MSMYRIRVPLLSAMLLLAAALAMASDVSSWSFQYVTGAVDNVDPPLIWFTREPDGGYGDRVSSQPLNADGTATTLHLHCESTGLVDMSMTLTPLTGDGLDVVGYHFSASGGIVGMDGTVEVEEDVDGVDVVVPLMQEGKGDPDLVRVKRLYALAWTPDVDEVEAARAGAYSCTLKVEVTCA